MNRCHPALSNLFDSSMTAVASQMLAANLITHDIVKNPTSNAIMTSFMSGFEFRDDLEEIEEHCINFFTAFHKIGGPLIHAANQIKKKIQEKVEKEVGIVLQLNM